MISPACWGNKTPPPTLLPLSPLCLLVCRATQNIFVLCQSMCVCVYLLIVVLLCVTIGVASAHRVCCSCVVSGGQGGRFHGAAAKVSLRSFLAYVWGRRLQNSAALLRKFAPKCTPPRLLTQVFTTTYSTPFPCYSAAPLPRCLLAVRSHRGWHETFVAPMGKSVTSFNCSGSRDSHQLNQFNAS